MGMHDCSGGAVQHIKMKRGGSVPSGKVVPDGGGEVAPVTKKKVTGLKSGGKVPTPKVVPGGGGKAKPKGKVGQI